MGQRGFTVRALGEIAIRCIDFDAMVAFYRDVIGLEPFNDPENGQIAFFRIAEGFGGHTAVLALFRHDVEGAGHTRAGDLPPIRVRRPRSITLRSACPGKNRTQLSRGMRSSGETTPLRHSTGLAGVASSPSTRTATPSSWLQRIRAETLIQRWLLGAFAWAFLIVSHRPTTR